MSSREQIFLWIFYMLCFSVGMLAHVGVYISFSDTWQCLGRAM